MRIDIAAGFAARFFLGLVFAGLVAARTPTAVLVGRVSDSSHAAVAGALVRVRTAGAITSNKPARIMQLRVPVLKIRGRV